MKRNLNKKPRQPAWWFRDNTKTLKTPTDLAKSALVVLSYKTPQGARKERSFNITREVGIKLQGLLMTLTVFLISQMWFRRVGWSSLDTSHFSNKLWKLLGPGGSVILVWDPEWLKNTSQQVNVKDEKKPSPHSVFHKNIDLISF